MHAVPFRVAVEIVHDWDGNARGRRHPAIIFSRADRVCGLDGGHDLALQHAQAPEAAGDDGGEGQERAERQRRDAGDRPGRWCSPAPSRRRRPSAPRRARLRSVSPVSEKVAMRNRPMASAATQAPISAPNTLAVPKPGMGVGGVQRQPLQRVAGGPHVGERDRRPRAWSPCRRRRGPVSAQPATTIEADRQPGEDVHGRGAEARVGEAVDEGGGGEERRERAGRRSRRARPVAVASRSPRPWVGDSRGMLVACSSAARTGAEQAADRHVGEEAEHDEGQQRAQVAAAGAREVAAGAAAREHHAEAEASGRRGYGRPS